MKTNRFTVLSAGILLAICGFAGQTALAQGPAERGPQENTPSRQPQNTPPRANEPARNPSRESNVNLADLAARVAATTGKRFFIGSAARSRIYVSGPELEHPTYPMFLVVLHANGLAAAEINGSTLIVPVRYARFLPSRIIQTDDQDIPAEEWVTQVITLHSAAAPRLVPILRPLMARPAMLSAFVSGRPEAAESKLVIVGRYANVRRITELVKELTQ